MAAGDGKDERRKHRRVEINFPVMYKIRRTTVMGRAVNACNEGMLVESFLALKTAFQILAILTKKRKHRINVEFTFKKRTYRTKAEMRHFHLDFSGSEPCRSELGFHMPRIT